MQLAEEHCRHMLVESSSSSVPTTPASVGGGGVSTEAGAEQQPSHHASDETLESPLVKAAIGAGCTWTYELCAGHSLEFIKVAKQTAPEKSYATLMQGIVRHKGALGLLDGFFPWGTVQAIAKGAVFSFAAAGARAAVEPLVESETVPVMVAEVLAGGVGGGFQGLVLSPTLLLKTRVMTDPIFRTDMSFTQCVCACVCACVRECVRACVRVCVCVRVVL